MFRSLRLSQIVLRSILTRQGDPTARTYVGAVYIGLGDQFDDDRRLVRETASTLRPVIHPTWVGTSRPAISADSRSPFGSSKTKLLRSTPAACVSSARLVGLPASRLLFG